MWYKHKKISLISHGTHTYHENNKLDLISSKEMAIGLAYTKNQRIKLLSQSTFCDDFLNSIKAKYTKINFLIGKEISGYKKEIYLKKERIQILYIGTIKPLGARRYYYESSAEIIGSILKIYSKLARYKKYFELIIRIRDVHNEINSDILNNAFGNLNEFITIRKGLNLKQEIDNCDCLISYSSTVLEQGLEQNKPVMCFGLPSYNHFKSYENKDISKDFPCKNKNLKIIEKALERKFILKSNIYKRHIEYFF